MTQTAIQEGHRLEWTTAANRSSGDVVLVGDTVGIATKTTLSGEKNVLLVGSPAVHTVPKANPQVWAPGERLYWNDGAGVFTNVSALGLYPCATVWEGGAASAATTGPAKLDGHAAVAV